MTGIGMEERRLAPSPETMISAADEASTRPQAVDWTSIVYLAITAAVLPFGFPQTKAFVLLGLHVIGIAFLLTARRWGMHRSSLGNLLLAFYPVILFAFLYTEIGYLDRLIHPHGFFDSGIQSLEEKVFGGQPSATLHQRLSSPILGEYLHLGYISYYLLVPILFAVLWFSGKRPQYFLSIATISLSFYISFLFFIFYPVAGPYQMFDAPPPADRVGLFLPDLVRYILDRGSAVGAAFPSSHVAVGVTVWIMAIRFHPILGLVYAFLIPSLAVGAVYGGYHYATDVVAGAILGMLVGTLGLGLVESLNRRRI